MNDTPLDPVKLQELLGPAWTSACLTATGSTNDDARQAAAEGAAHGHFVLADAQSAGRGRRGSVWVSPPRRNLTGSVVLRPGMPCEFWSRLTHACAVAVCSALERLPGLPAPQIKWPNDIYLNDRKVCGILVESSIDRHGGFVVAGVGVNLNLTSADFPSELQDTATSVWLELGGQAVDREAFAADFHRALLHAVKQAESDFDSILGACSARSWLEGKQVRLQTAGREMTGIVEGLSAAGELLLRETGSGLLHSIASADLVRPV